MSFVYNQWDYGFRDQPIQNRADFGGRGNSFGIGAMDQGSYHFNDQNTASPELLQMQVDAANIKAANLQLQIDELERKATSANSAVFAAQISSLKSELAATKSLASTDVVALIQKNLPMIALGLGGIMVLAMLLRRNA